MNSIQLSVKQTALFDTARKLGATFVDVNGWQVPDLFSNINDELTVARQATGLADSSASGKILVEGGAAESVLQEIWSVPRLKIGQGVVVNAKGIYRLRSDQFFIHLEPGSEGELLTSLNEKVSNIEDLFTVTNLTHGQAELLLVGPASAQLLGRLCGLDFHPSSFPDLTAKQSSVAKTRQLILHRDIKQLDGPPVLAYSIIGGRSLAAYLWNTILEAGQDLEISPVGQSALNRLLAG